QVGRIALGAARLHPLCKQSQLGVREATLTREVAVARLRRPRRHVAALGDGNDLRSMLAHVLVGQQRKRRRLSWAVTRRTILKYKGGDSLTAGPRLALAQEPHHSKC